jgi:hypothetical protein
MPFLLLLGSLLLLPACAPKKNTPVVVAAEVKSMPSLPGAAAPRVPEREGFGTRVQIACEAGEAGLLLPNSKRITGDRVREQIKPGSQSELAAPAILALRGGVARILFREQNTLKVTDYSFNDRVESGARYELPVAFEADSPIYEQLGIMRPRLAAVSPQRDVFLLLTAGFLEIRAVQNPVSLVEKFSLKGKHGNPRWEPRAGDQLELFLDQLGMKRMRQVWATFKGNNLNKLHTLPKARFGHQIGLRRWDEQTLVWLEWEKNRSTLRLLNTETGDVKNYVVPAVKSNFGPGFALYRLPSGQKSVVLQSSVGIHFFTAAGAKLEPVFTAHYSALVTDNIRRGFHQWSPGAVYSTANDTQLFAVLPTTWGKLLYSLEEGGVFHQLGHDSCLNPDFYPEE